MLDNEPGAVNGTAPGTDATTIPAGAENTAAADPTTGDTPAPRRTRRRTTKAVPAEATAQPAADAAGAAEAEPARPARRRRRAAAEPAETATGEQLTAGQPAAAAQPPSAAAEPAPVVAATPAGPGPTPDQPGADTASNQTGDEAASAPVTRTSRTRRRPVKAEPVTAESPAAEPVTAEPAVETEPVAEAAEPQKTSRRRVAPSTAVLFMPPSEAEAEAEAEAARVSRRRRGRRGDAAEPAAPVAEAEPEIEETDEVDDEAGEEEDDSAAARRRRRRGRRGRGRGKGGYGDEENGDATADDAEETDEPEETDDEAEAEAEAEAEDGDGDGSTRRRRRRRRKGAGDVEAAPDDPANTVVKIREPRPARERDRDEVQGVSGSTRLEAKRQRRRDGREQRRTRPPILSESEFLARREAVDRVMVVRQKGDRTQIGVLEDGILVEHYVSRASAATMVGNVYLGRVQNVLPSMEAAFVDIGRGRNAVLYAGEVNWEASGLEGRTRTIEQALKSGDSVLVQVTKDPIGTKGARLTSHIALSGRHLVYVPNGNTSGISRKLSDVERKRLRDVLKNLVPESAGVIVRTAAEGASEDELARDVKRLQAQWEEIDSRSGESGAPKLLYEEPDLLIRVVRDLFNEDFRELVVQGDDAFQTIEPYLQHVSPDLVQRVHRHTGTGDVFHEMRVDEQILKGLDRRVFLPSGGSLVIDRTEAMTVVDVNTGKYTGTGGNLEETVTRNNLEAAEEIVRQLRLRDLGGIIVIDFIDMVLESNRELVLRRLTECLGRDRTKHQVTEITSLGLVQMTRKRVGQGLLEAFSENCEVCKGRGLIIHSEPIPEKRGSASAAGGSGQAKAAPAKAEEPSENGRGSRRRRKGSPAAEPAPADDLVPADDAVDASTADASAVTSEDDALDGHEATFAGLDPVPAVGFDDDGLELEEEPVGGRRRGRRRR
jgi:ribonuclease E